jgi:hypothetical protein
VRDVDAPRAFSMSTTWMTDRSCRELERFANEGGLALVDDEAAAARIDVDSDVESDRAPYEQDQGSTLESRPARD